MMLSQSQLVSTHKEIGELVLKSQRSFSDPEVFRTLTTIMPVTEVVVPVEPFKMNERMLLQQGLFLAPVSINCRFESSLLKVLRYAEESGEVKAPILYKMVIRPSAHPHLLRELYRMNVSYESLFPGLDGLARSVISVAKIRETGSRPGDPPMWDTAFGR